MQMLPLTHLYITVRDGKENWEDLCYDLFFSPLKLSGVIDGLKSFIDVYSKW